MRQFPDGESYLCVNTNVVGAHCLVLANLAHPNDKYLPLIFLTDTLCQLGAASVGLVAPYLSYMRQDRRFVEGEAITSRIFAKQLSAHADWLVTVDPHLHRYHTLNEIYDIPNRVVQGALALASWLKNQDDIFLVGPDAESEQWVSQIASISGHPFVIGEKQRHGDCDVVVELPDLDQFRTRNAVIIDDVISSGHTVLRCIEALISKGITEIRCAAVHGIFADNIDTELMRAGLAQLVTTNTIPHRSNRIDVTDLLIEPINACIESMAEREK